HRAASGPPPAGTPVVQGADGTESVTPTSGTNNVTVTVTIH
ncbi:MAG: hypothetical protein QOF18_2398, partial [Frankiaceae bacterium]|nr:hypothetical protein [Frankiaceae bacterium]